MIAGKYIYIRSFQSFPVLLLESPNGFSKIATAIIGDVVASRNWKYISVSKNSGTPKWMVYNGNPIKMDDFGVKTPIFGNTHMIWMLIVDTHTIFGASCKWYQMYQ